VFFKLVVAKIQELIKSSLLKAVEHGRTVSHEDAKRRLLDALETIFPKMKKAKGFELNSWQSDHFKQLYNE